MSSPSPSGASGARALSGAAFLTLLLIALLMASNHVSARFAFNHGTDVATAVTVRSLVTATVLAILIAVQGVSFNLTARHKRGLPILGLLVGAQSLCLYSGVARIPIALALLAFNSYPIWTALFDWLIYRRRPERAALIAMPIILVGLALALDVSGAASGLAAADQWRRIGTGVGFALAAAALFGLALVVTQHETAGLDGRVRTASTMLLAGLVAMAAALAQGGFHFPQAAPGWWGLAGLTLLFGTGFTILFTVLPRLGVGSNTAILNVEPVFALVLAWALLGQSIAPVQLVGALLVVGTVVALGLRKR